MTYTALYTFPETEEQFQRFLHYTLARKGRKYRGLCHTDCPQCKIRMARNQRKRDGRKRR